ncbi:hypothetical protein [Desulfosarcina variabilis]|uniref:hypothetical protein n=1 Tax=Desulfosarcina variabilis TaxID=2300 RepID=UPI003AFA6F19
MKLLLFGDTPTGQIRRLQSLVNDHLPGIQTQTIISFEHLLQHLRKPLNRTEAIVMFLSSQEAIGQALGLKPFLYDTRRILVLPNNYQTTFSMAVHLIPSFITYPEMGLNDILAVLERILIKT